MERGRGTETEEGLGTQFGAVTQDSSKPCRRPACQIRLVSRKRRCAHVCLTTVAQSEGLQGPGVAVRASTVMSAFPLPFSASPSAQTLLSVAEIADDEPAG